MKVWFTLFILLLLGTAGYFGAVHFSGGAFPAFGLPLGGERAALRKISLQFMEDIEFKDFEKAASYHAPDIQRTVDIPFLIQRLFKVKPEALEIMEYEIVFAKIDTTELRARVKLRIKVKFLGNEQIRNQELLLFYEREKIGAPWHMKLEDSLRNTKADKNKIS